MVNDHIEAVHELGGPSSAPSESTGHEYYPWADPQFEWDPYPWYARAQAEVPVFQEDDGTYVLSRYDDVMTFGKHPAMSVESGWEAAGPWAVNRNTIAGNDPPNHTRLRRVSNKWFSPKMVQEWVKTTEAATNEMLDGMVDNVLDGWRDLSVVPTHRTMCHLMGLPDDDAVGVNKEICDAMPMLSARPRDGAVEKATDGFEKLRQRAMPIVTTRAADDGLVEGMRAAQLRGDMSETEMQTTSVLFYGFGTLDTSYVIAAGLRIFAERPDVYDDYREHPALRDAIVNEVIRLEPPETSFYRTTTEEITVGSTVIPAGSMIRFLVAAANRDPEVFPNPNQFDHHRPVDQSRNLSFGVGAHSCVAQVLSRAEIRTIYDTVAQRIRKIELVEPVEMDNTDFSRHFTKLTLRLTE